MCDGQKSGESVVKAEKSFFFLPGVINSFEKQLRRGKKSVKHLEMQKEVMSSDVKESC